MAGDNVDGMDRFFMGGVGGACIGAIAYLALVGLLEQKLEFAAKNLVFALGVGAFLGLVGALFVYMEHLEDKFMELPPDDMLGAQEMQPMYNWTRVDSESEFELRGAEGESPSR